MRFGSDLLNLIIIEVLILFSTPIILKMDEE